MSKKKYLNDREKEFPAKYSDSLMLFLQDELRGYEKILDPFAGTGKIRTVRPDAYLLEIEPEWAEIRGATVGDALELPWPNNYFDAVVTSPTYGNRMADHHNAKDGSKRNTYRHTLGRELSPHNSGAMQWGKKYRTFHYTAWDEVRRVLKPDGKFILNISDHIRKGRQIQVTRFHRLLLLQLGFTVERDYRISTPRNGQGQNGKVRVPFESILVFKLIKPQIELKAKIDINEFRRELAKFSEYWPNLKDLPDGVDPFPHYPIAGEQ